MKRWAIYCAGNSDYVLSEYEEPLKMLRSFKHFFKEQADYVYFTDTEEHLLQDVEKKCVFDNVRLVTGECKKYYEHYCDKYYREQGLKERWPAAVFWYCEAPFYLKEYDFLLKCDGDMLCNKYFSLEELETDNAVTIAEAPDWYIPYDKFSPNNGFQVINVKEYLNQKINEFFRRFSKKLEFFNSDQPILDYLIGTGMVQASRVSSDFNYLLFDVHDATLLITNH